MNKLITNSADSNFYNHITKLFEECKAFYFNVAFINYSGVQLLLESLESCKKRGIKAKILTSTYLNFTEPKALRRILDFENIELRIYDSNSLNRGFHSKAYIFEYENDYKVLLGSSNITSSAFKTNIEWNIKSIQKKDEPFIKEILTEYNSIFEEAFLVDNKFIFSYEEFYKKKKVKSLFIKRSLF